MQPLYIALRPFDPDDGEKWDKYKKWSGLTQLDELVTLDPMLCPLLLDKTEDHFWPYIVNEDYMTDYFIDVEFLVAETARFARKNILCVFRNPAGPPDPPTDPFAFKLLGYDLIDVTWSVSALSNCGGFPDEFDNGELNKFGLLPDHGRAYEIRDLLRTRHPQEHHANCDVWAICRADPRPDQVAHQTF